jgi:hypothetical protein
MPFEPVKCPNWGEYREDSWLGPSRDWDVLMGESIGAALDGIPLNAALLKAIVAFGTKTSGSSNRNRGQE